MLTDFSWFQPLPRNFAIEKRRLRLWRRWGRSYRRSREFKLLEQIESHGKQFACDSADGRGNAYWLLPYRSDFRRTFARYHAMGNDGNLDVFRYYLAYCPAEMIPICVWMVGNCADRFQTYGVTEFRRDWSPQIRKHVAKALRRLEAWQPLEEMADLNPADATIQRIAQTPVRRRPFTERLSTYVRSVDDSHAGEVKNPSAMPFWTSQRKWDYTPPKSVQLIRRMLRRIRHWVRWGVH